METNLNSAFEEFLENQIRPHIPSLEEQVTSGIRRVARRCFYGTHYNQLFPEQQRVITDNRVADTLVDDEERWTKRRKLSLQVPVACLEIGQDLYHRFVAIVPGTAERYRIVCHS